MPYNINIVTPVFNCQDLVDPYIYSVKPCLPLVKIIFVDGGSSDKTLQLVQKYAHLYPNIEAISLPCCGIYEAMNYASSLITDTSYILYLGIDDGLLSPYLLSSFLKSSILGSYDAIFFDVIEKRERTVSKKKYYYKKKCFNVDFKSVFSPRYFLRPPFHHQGFLVKAQIAKEHKINCDLGIHADYANMISVYNSCNTVYLPLALTYYSLGGKSDYFSWQHFDSMIKVAAHCNIAFFNSIFCSPLLFLKLLLKLLLPKKLIQIKRELTR